MTVPPAIQLRRAWLVWAVGLAAYVLAVFHRSSLAVAGLEATDRFGISASQLATFTMLQLLVYALMQVPVGLLVDRFGPRRVLLTGVLVLSAAQCGFALAESYPAALVARVFVGLGDAMTFICVLRVVSAWFPAQRIPLVTALTGTIGQAGAIASAIPMTWALREVGWTTSYLTAALVGPLLAVAMFAVLQDAPGRTNVPGHPMRLGQIRESLATSWAQPGTRLAFWVHFMTPFSANALALLWGLPFFVRGEGRSEETAGALLTVMVVVVMFSGPVLGWLMGRVPWHRSTMALVTVYAMVIVWTVVLLWRGDAPLPLLVLLVVVAGVGGPASMIGFDIGRTTNPPARYASASGIINQGGFLASLLLVLMIGWILDWRTPGSSNLYSPEAFRWAMSAQYLLWAVGLFQTTRYRRRARAAHLAAGGKVGGQQVPAP